MYIDMYNRTKLRIYDIYKIEVLYKMGLKSIWNSLEDHIWMISVEITLKNNNITKK